MTVGMADAVQGYLIIKVAEATGKNARDEFVWDSNQFEAFVRVELRGGARSVKKQTKPAGFSGTSIVWNQELVLEVLEGANELRLMVCREKIQNGKRGTSVLAACGIYVQDILGATPIDKFFELFKPGHGGDGGFIRVSMNHEKQLTPSDTSTEIARAPPAETGSAQPVLQHQLSLLNRPGQPEDAPSGPAKKGPPLFLPVLVAAAAAVIWVVKRGK